MPVSTEAELAVRDVAREALDREGDWAALSGAGLTSLPVPEEYGGDGLGLAEVAVLLREVGRRASTLPVWEALCCGALTLAAAGSSGQCARLLPGLAAGELLVVPALREAGAGIPARPSTTFADGRVTGQKISVGHADEAAALLVPALDGDDVVIALVDPRAAGVALRHAPTSTGATAHSIHLDGAAAQLLPGEGAATLLRGLAVAGLTVLGAGLVAGARDLTARHVAERRQFGRALAEFQAVAQQVADVYVASRTLDLAADAAIGRVVAGDPGVHDLAVAAYWTCAEAPTALHVCHHLHGGTGVDESYPLHRYFSAVTDISALLGGEQSTLDALTLEPAADKNAELTADQRALKAELRDYFADLVTPEDHREMGRDRHGPTYQRTIKQLGQDGWMGIGWPTEYGGKGLGEVEQTIFANEAQRADVHLPAVTLQTVGPTLQRFGTPAQKERFLGPILAGDVHFAIGYSEPDAGTDLAALRTTARREGDHYVVNGQKLWTTGGHQADYLWLAARTDPDAPKHRGISILIVDTQDPGYTWTPIITADGSHHVNATFFDDVRVPVDMLVGEENDGWRLITTQLNHERVMLAPAGRLEGLRDRVADWARTAGVAQEPDVRRVLGEVTAAFRVNELLNWEVARQSDQGSDDPKRVVADASASKVFSSERVQRLGRLLREVVQRYGDPADPVTAELADYLDAQAKRNLVLTFGGGVNEVQRELICQFGLGLPRVPR